MLTKSSPEASRSPASPSSARPTRGRRPACCSPSDDRAASARRSRVRSTRCRVVAADGMSQAELTDRIAPTLPDGHRGAHRRRDHRRSSRPNPQGSMGFFNTFLHGLRRHRAVRRCVHHQQHLLDHRRPALAGDGAAAGDRREPQAGDAVGAREAAVVGLVASVAGLVAGIGVAAGLKGLFGAIGFDIPGGPVVVTTKTVVMALVTGSVSRSVRPGSPLVVDRRSRRSRPCATATSTGPRLEATDRHRPRHHGCRRCRLSAGLGGAGVTLVLLGALAVFIGVAVLGPVLARPVVRVIGAPLPPAGHHRLARP